MQIGVTTCPADMPLVEAVRTLLHHRLEAVVVLDDNGHAVGLFGQQEAVGCYGLSQTCSGNLEALTVAEAMRPEIPEIPPDIPATAAAQLMLDQHVRELYLMHHDGGISWPAAVLRFEDILRHVAMETEAT
jgi:CBS domain-containing protein